MTSRTPSARSGDAEVPSQAPSTTGPAAGERRHTGSFRLALLALLSLVLAGGASAGPHALRAPPRAVVPGGDLTGRWLLVEVASTQASLGALGEVRSEIHGAVLMDLVHHGDRLTGQGELCEFRLKSPTSLVRIEFPAGFRRALERPTLDARVEEKGGVLHFEQPQVFAVLGAHLRRPRGEPLPEGPDDPRVIDADGDGKPGVTVLVRGLIDGEIYLVQRTWNALVGRAVSAQRFEGALLHGKEEVVLGATHDVLAAFPPTRPDPAGSRFVLERARAGATCQDAVGRMEALVGGGE